MFAVLVAISALSVGLQLGKWVVVGKIGAYFLVWNLFLAWLPMILSTAIWGVCRRRRSGNGLFVGLLACLWLLFFPNAPYLVTDLEHIGKATGAPAWYDALTYFCYGLAGLLLGFTSLRQLQSLLVERVGAGMSWVFVVTVTVLSAFGTYLGRVLRWNSWDVLREPSALGWDIWVRLSAPWEHPHTVAFTVLFGGVLLLAYVAFVLFPRLERVE
ncbi:MAG: DUF1361 domain-containing protein [Verrucomicrobiota bacterium]